MQVPVLQILTEKDEVEILQKVFTTQSFNQDVLFPPSTEWINPRPGRRNSDSGSFEDLSDDEVIGYLTNVERFTNVRKIADGSFVGCVALAFTTGVFVDISENSPFAYRWCFADHNEAVAFCNTVEKFDEVPTSRKSLKGHRYVLESRLAVIDNLGFVKW